MRLVLRARPGGPVGLADVIARYVLRVAVCLVLRALVREANRSPEASAEHKTHRKEQIVAATVARKANRGGLAEYKTQLAELGERKAGPTSRRHAKAQSALLSHTTGRKGEGAREVSFLFGSANPCQQDSQARSHLLRLRSTRYETCGGKLEKGTLLKRLRSTHHVKRMREYRRRGETRKEDAAKLDIKQDGLI